MAWLRGKLSGLADSDYGDSSAEKDTQPDKLRAIIEASEQAIFELEQQTGFDWYWRAYFWLLRR